MKIYNFPENSEVLKFLLPVKIYLHNFSTVSGVEMKSFWSSPSHFAASPGDFTLANLHVLFAPIKVFNHLANNIISNLRILSVKNVMHSSFVLVLYTRNSYMYFSGSQFYPVVYTWLHL